ncbi:MAG: PrsW family intramembrane metalloprotease [Bacteroidetes bacterium HGW-Bacteroidetes-21]|jgi:RsiW-degrading membrane proteinase PrsW (M82 family)|nr:MAG: PrsW family intramembrane metalloprotease [Bacteroidetes bacterium HGW-Bacteroidetes-21]
MILLLISLAPVITILLYVYFRDKYEKEPIGQLLKGFFSGLLVFVICVFVELLISALYSSGNVYVKAFYDGFIVAGFTEELFKFLAVMLLFWHNRNFNEKFDGIVYSVFVSLGFAATENIFYVFEGGLSVGILRAFTAVPAHALFGIIMGFYIGLARFDEKRSGLLLWSGFFYAWIFHGLYDFLLMTGNAWFVLLEIPFMIFLIRKALIRMRRLSAESVFIKTDND